MFPRVIYASRGSICTVQLHPEKLLAQHSEMNSFRVTKYPGELIERPIRSDYYALMEQAYVPSCAAHYPSRCVSVRMKLSDSAFTHERDRRSHRVRSRLLHEARRNAREHDVIDRNCPFFAAKYSFLNRATFQHR